MESVSESSLLEWARIKTELRKARKETLERLGYTEQSLRYLADNALSEMFDDDRVETEYGSVVKKAQGRVQWTPLRSADPKKQYFKPTLELITNKEQENGKH